LKALRVKYKGRGFKKDAIKALEKELPPVVKSEENEDDNFNKLLDAQVEEPTDELGFGISSWMSLLRFLMGVFALLSCFALFLAYKYNQAGHISGAGFPYDQMAQWTLGNLGEARTICLSQFARLDSEREIKCKKGTIGQLVYYGAHTGSKTAMV
jgi:hypothetical protein